MTTKTGKYANVSSSAAKKLGVPDYLYITVFCIPLQMTLKDSIHLRHNPILELIQGYTTLFG